MILLHKHFGKQQKPVTIGICSLQHRTGVTCFSIAFANYLYSKTKKPTAYAEVNGSGQAARLNGNDRSAFSLQGVDYYPETTSAHIPEILTRNYRWIILDLGLPGRSYMPEFERCDIRLMLVDGSPWHLEEAEQGLSDFLDHREGRGEITLLGNPWPQKKLQTGSKLHQFPHLQVPYISDPFLIFPRDFWIFEKILTGV